MFILFLLFFHINFVILLCCFAKILVVFSFLPEYMGDVQRETQILEYGQ